MPFIQPVHFPIRRAESKDLEDLLALELSCFDPGMAFHRRQIQSLLVNPRADFWLLSSPRGPIAQLLILRRRCGPVVQARIYSLTVAHEFRGRGLARQLLDWGLASLRKSAVERVYLEVEATAQAPLRLYQSYGFNAERSLPDYYGEGRHGLKMGLNL